MGLAQVGRLESVPSAVCRVPCPTEGLGGAGVSVSQAPLDQERLAGASLVAVSESRLVARAESLG